jgi:hypothetical protein
MGYQFLNIFFFAFHTLLMLFNCFGWAWKKTRLWNLITLFLTASSWFIVGIWYGWGYCFCTDWHWDVREKMGLYDQSNSYVHFLLLKLTGINFQKELVDKTTLIAFFLSLVISIWLNISDFRKRKQIKNRPDKSGR